MSMVAKVLIVKNVRREELGLFYDVLRAHNVATDVIEAGEDEAFPLLDGYGAIVVLGGPPSANAATPTMRAEVALAADALARSLPYLGVGLGMQVLVKAGGGAVVPVTAPEVGFTDVDRRPHVYDLTPEGIADPLFDGVESRFRVFQRHVETVELAAGMYLLATAAGCPNQAVRVGRNAYGLQAHVEVTPDLLVRWTREDPDLSSFDPLQLTAELSSIGELHSHVGRRVFTNFLALAGIIDAVDLTSAPSSELPEREEQHSGR